MNPKWMLRGKIISMYGSVSAFAEHIGKTKGTVSNKLAGRTQMSQEDIIEWANALNLDAESLVDYFFADLVSKN